jgi:hypothetical protein
MIKIGDNRHHPRERECQHQECKIAYFACQSGLITDRNPITWASIFQCAGRGVLGRK